jgi:hypothetical protein
MGDLNAVSSSSSVVEGEVGHLFPAPTSQHNASPVIFVVPTTNNYLSYLGKELLYTEAWIKKLPWYASVPVPINFGTDPDPDLRIHTSD